MTVSPIEIERDEGVVLRGEIEGESDRWAILLHDFGGDLDNWKPMRRKLISAGVKVFSLDLRGHGASDGEWSPEATIGDIEASIRHCRFANAKSVYLIGAGQAATASIVAAGEEVVQALVCLSPVLELEGIDSSRLRVSRAPKLFTVGASNIEAMRAAQALYRKMLGWRMLESRAVEEQGTDLLNGPGSEHIFEKTVGFLKSY
tara:strand:- start:131 stop:739 length:609 start_codon:yes stop_codon:yes gene_type:complete